MKSIVYVLAVLLSFQNAEAHYRSRGHKSEKHEQHSRHHGHEKHHGDRDDEDHGSCGGGITPTTPPPVVCSADERVVNGDFESNPVTNSSQWQLLTSLTGWKINWTKSDCCSSAPYAELQAFASEQLPGSTQYIELDTHYQQNSQCSANTNIQISQEIEAKVGEVLKLSFNYKPRSLQYGKMALTVNFGSNNLLFGGFTDTNWKTFSKEYKVSSWDLKNGKMSLTIKDTGLANTYGMFVDNVSVKATNCTTPAKLCTAATSVVSYSPVGTIASSRKNPLKALGLPDGEPVNESDIRFTSLGFGGQIVLKLDSPVKNVVGPDLRIWETTGGDMSYSQYQEEADVYVSADGITWTYAGHVLNENGDASLGMVDISPLEEASYVKIVDQSPFFNESGRDGFDVDAVTCHNQVNDYEGQFYYVDNATRKLYKGAVENTNVFLKEVMNIPYTNGQIAQLDFETLVLVENGGAKRVKKIDIATKAMTDAGQISFTGTTGQMFASENYLLVNQEGTNKIYHQNLDTNATTLLGQVMYNNAALILTEGDIYESLSGTLYVITNANGGSLYALEKDSSNPQILNATLIVQNLGLVTGLIEMPSGEMLVSLRNSTIMKVVDVYSKTVRSVNLKGDLPKQGSQGGDLARFDTL